MTDTKHTPGPWRIEDQWILHECDPDDQAICQWGSYTTEANARLIAKSPEMVDLIKAAMPTLSSYAVAEKRANLAPTGQPPRTKANTLYEDARALLAEIEPI